MIFIFSILAAVLFTACDPQPELCFDHYKHDLLPVEVIFDWHGCPDAEPNSMCLYIFPEGDHSPTRFDFKGHAGGLIMLRPGRYSAVALNSDSKNTAVSYDDGIESFELWLRESFTANAAGVCNAADMVWLGITEDFSLDAGVITVPMREAVCRCEVDIKHVSNHQYIHTAGAMLSGLNESVSAVARAGASGSVSVNFELECNDDASLHAEFLTLGHCGLARSRSSNLTLDSIHNINILFTLSDGTTWNISEDVTAQVHNQPAEYCHIVIDSIALPDKGRPSGGGGLGYGVDDWQPVEINIKP